MFAGMEPIVMAPGCWCSPTGGYMGGAVAVINSTAEFRGCKFRANLAFTSPGHEGEDRSNLQDLKGQRSVSGRGSNLLDIKSLDTYVEVGRLLDEDTAFSPACVSWCFMRRSTPPAPPTQSISRHFYHPLLTQHSYLQTHVTNPSAAHFSLVFCPAPA